LSLFYVVEIERRVINGRLRWRVLVAWVPQEKSLEFLFACLGEVGGVNHMFDLEFCSRSFLRKL